jgi:hypothetical protein
VDLPKISSTIWRIFSKASSVRKAETSIIEECNPLMHNFNITILHCSYMFWLLQSNYLLAVYQMCKKVITLHVVCGQDLDLAEGITYIGLYVCVTSLSDTI